MLLMSSKRITLNKRTLVVLAAVFFAVVLVLPAVTPTVNFLKVSLDGTQSAFAAQDEKKPGEKFHLEEATISDIHNAIMKKEITCTELVNQYLDRIKAYNGTCVNQPQGILGPISTIPHAGQLNAFSTLNLRPNTRIAMGFDGRKARSMTDLIDADPTMPDALQVAAALDAKFETTKKLSGPLHCVVMAIKDAFDTFDMRTTSGADAFYTNDRPPDDATVVAELRAAGAIILAKSNLAEYQGGQPRSSFGGTFCNPYDTERDPGYSSSGSGSGVGANLVTCAIAEETGGSVRHPARSNNAVGISSTRELVTADGMIQQGWNTRTGPICRTVEDAARILDVFAGFDPKDEITAFSVNRIPAVPYQSFAKNKRLDRVRIGVVREYMDKSLFTQADFETIDIINRAINDLRGLGATIIDPGEHGSLFQSCVDKIVPEWRNQLFISQFPLLFPAGADHIPLLVDMYLNPSLIPHDVANGQPNVRNLGPAAGTGDAKYNFNVYLQERGDSNIQSLTDLINKANFFPSQTGLGSPLNGLINNNTDLTVNNANILQNRFTLQMIVNQCFGEKGLDAVTYPTSNIPPKILTNPAEPTVNDRNPGRWAFMAANGLPAITVPAGFTTVVYDRDANRNLLPIAARLPVGIDFLCLPFDEPKCIKIASAYEAATHHRTPPPDFGPVDEDGIPLTARTPGKPRQMPKPSKLTEEEIREAAQD